MVAKSDGEVRPLEIAKCSATTEADVVAEDDKDVGALGRGGEQGEARGEGGDEEALPSAYVRRGAGDGAVTESVRRKRAPGWATVAASRG